jgi:trigger factor
MKVKLEKESACRKKLRIEVPAEEVTSEYEAITKAYAKTARIPGFRPGRAPRNLVTNRFGKDILQEVQDRLVPKGYHHAIKEKDLNPVAILAVEEVKLETGKPMSFSVTLDVPPDFKIPSYKGISLKSEAVDVKDEEVEKTLSSLREQHGTFEDVADRAVEADDLVQIDYEGVCEGTAIAELAPAAEGIGKGEDFWVHVGEHAFLPGFAEGMPGLKMGEKGQIQVDFEKTFHVPELAGKKATYFVDVKAIRQRVPAELTEEFLKPFGVKTGEELRARIQEDLTKNAEAREQGRLKSEVVKHLMGKTRMDLPESIVEEETRRAVYDIVRRTAAGGASQEDIEKRRDELFEAARLSASDKVKARYLLNAIAAEEHIEAAATEIDNQIASMAQSHGVPEIEMRARLKKENMMEDLATQVRVDKVLDFLLENAKIK